MLERLDYVRLDPARILDAGSGRPRRELGRRYPRARTIALDFSLAMLGRRRPFGRLLARDVRVCGDMRALPLADASVELVWCNMALHWLADPLSALRELHRVLAAEGLLMFSMLGPDTLKELRVAAGGGRVHDFTDMHDLGDMLVACGFSAPVMDMEMLTIAYRDADALLGGLRRSGQTSARADRPRGLSGRRFGERLRAALGAAPRASFEVVYGHAWKAAPRRVADGRAIVDFHPRRAP